MITLTDEGLYFFLGRSDKQAALSPPKWIAEQVIPLGPKDGGTFYGGPCLP